MAGLSDRGPHRRYPRLLALWCVQGKRCGEHAVHRCRERLRLGRRREDAARVARARHGARDVVGDRRAMPRELDDIDAERRIQARDRRKDPDAHAAVGARADDHARRLSLGRDIADPRRERPARDRSVEGFGLTETAAGASLARNGPAPRTLRSVELISRSRLSLAMRPLPPVRPLSLRVLHPLHHDWSQRCRDPSWAIDRAGEWWRMPTAW